MPVPLAQPAPAEGAWGPWRVKQQGQNGSQDTGAWEGAEDCRSGDPGSVHRVRAPMEAWGAGG